MGEPSTASAENVRGSRNSTRTPSGVPARSHWCVICKEPAAVFASVKSCTRTGRTSSIKDMREPMGSGAATTVCTESVRASHTVLG